MLFPTDCQDMEPSVACRQSDQKDHAGINRAGAHQAIQSTVDPCSLWYLQKFKHIQLTQQGIAL